VSKSVLMPDSRFDRELPSRIPRTQPAGSAQTCWADPVRVSLRQGDVRPMGPLGGKGAFARPVTGGRAGDGPTRRGSCAPVAPPSCGPAPAAGGRSPKPPSHPILVCGPDGSSGRGPFSARATAWLLVLPLAGHPLGQPVRGPGEARATGSRLRIRLVRNALLFSF